MLRSCILTTVLWCCSWPGNAHRHELALALDFDPNKDYFAVLGVQVDATEQEIRKAYKKLSLTRHPDRGGSTEEFQLLNEATEVLTDSGQRKEYDRQRPGKTRRQRRTTTTATTTTTTTTTTITTTTTTTTKRRRKRADAFLNFVDELRAEQQHPPQHPQRHQADGNDADAFFNWLRAEQQHPPQHPQRHQAEGGRAECPSGSVLVQAGLCECKSPYMCRKHSRGLARGCGEASSALFSSSCQDCQCTRDTHETHRCCVAPDGRGYGWFRKSKLPPGECPMFHGQQWRSSTRKCKHQADSLTHLLNN